ncbi:MAG TPA: transcription termination/antitermination protein NusG [Clostridia bacterium]|jgi:transcriptional antiterminator NusG|nr:transcription termination/antitermination protein NusG [Clostridiaceae bacterium]HOR90370.1 transcription termination/antitermination protein NusG [Clostridia bacterium]HPL08977.1 transcription termination/antitermination protein NusG [Clostridia bacterium]
MEENLNTEITEKREEQDLARWYVVHTYSGYENKVKADLEKIVENREMQEYIQEIVVPLEEVIEEKNGKRKITFKKIFPGYVIVKMIMNDQSWYVVRNTRGVTGFVGPSARPVPLTAEEVIQMRLEGMETVIDFNVGDNIRVIEGPFENFVGIIKEVDKDKRKVKVHISIFGRETPVELDYDQIQIIL